MTQKRSERKRKVVFDPEIKVQKMYVWSFAYSEARKSDYMHVAADRCRFDKRIRECNEVISPILSDEHRKFIAVKLNIVS